jgi:hypothetical protein
MFRDRRRPDGRATENKCRIIQRFAKRNEPVELIAFSGHVMEFGNNSSIGLQKCPVFHAAAEIWRNTEHVRSEHVKLSNLFYKAIDDLVKQRAAVIFTTRGAQFVELVDDKQIDILVHIFFEHAFLRRDQNISLCSGLRAVRDDFVAVAESASPAVCEFRR